MAKTTLAVTITVMYEKNGVSEAELKDLLHDIASRAVDNGMLTGETNAEVLRWNSHVEKGELRC